MTLMPGFVLSPWHSCYTNTYTHGRTNWTCLLSAYGLNWLPYAELTIHMQRQLFPVLPDTLKYRYCQHTASLFLSKQEIFTV